MITSDAEEALLIDLYERVNPGVVHLRVYDASSLLGSGSGFLFDNERHIVTNNHVVEAAVKIEVVFSDMSRSWARVVGFDLDADLAVLQADRVPDGAFPLELGDSEAARVGQRVIAIGNPFGLQGTMTVGIISGIGRRLDSQRSTVEGGTYSNPGIIQTDAAINPGNSGGPLMDSNGKVIGINTAIRSLSGSNSGVGFAAPVNTVRKLVPHLIRDGKYTYAWMGISGLQEINLQTMEELGLSRSTGVYVTAVTSGGPAANAGLRAGTMPSGSGLRPGRGGDLIVAIDGNPLIDFGDLVSYLVAKTEPGQEVVLTIIRDGSTMDLSLTLGERP
jgi:2-alkenal reductase